MMCELEVKQTTTFHKSMLEVALKTNESSTFKK